MFFLDILTYFISFFFYIVYLPMFQLFRIFSLCIFKFSYFTSFYIFTFVYFNFLCISTSSSPSPLPHGSKIRCLPQRLRFNALRGNVAQNRGMRPYIFAPSHGYKSIHNTNHSGQLSRRPHGTELGVCRSHENFAHAGKTSLAR